MSEVSEAYLLGIREGRALYRETSPTLDDMRAYLDNCKAQLKRGFSGDMAQNFRGQRDFWELQIKLKR